MSTVNFNTHLPGYEVLAELGRGNMRVLKARQVATGDVVAIKQYAFPADADTLRRFERESQIMTQIDHPNVVRVREVQLTAAMPYVVMDYVEGGDLRGLLRQEGSLSIPTIIRLGLQLTQAFRAFHPLRVVHRDIKPENILYRRLVTGELHVLLTDFGIAKFWSEDNARTRTGQSMMTCEYAAPEQFDNPRQIDEAADYYALGAVLYECLTGGVPFKLHSETGLAQFMQQVLTAPVPKPAMPSGEPMPPSLENLLMSLLARHPQERLRNPDQLELLLEQSRVEYLQSNFSTRTTTESGARTLAGPVATQTATYAPAAESEEMLVGEPTADNNWMFWGMGGAVIAAGLAFMLYTRATNQPADKTGRADSSAVVAADSSQVQSQAVFDRSDSDVDTTAEATTEEPPVIEPAPIESNPEPVPTDSTPRRATVPDSVGTAESDSSLE